VSVLCGDCSRLAASLRRWAVMVAGCMTPEKAYRESNETGVRLATAFWQQQSAQHP
jgi:hypothetical protein